jgi:hypothetical protein
MPRPTIYLFTLRLKWWCHSSLGVTLHPSYIRNATPRPQNCSLIQGFCCQQIWRSLCRIVHIDLFAVAGDLCASRFMLICGRVPARHQRQEEAGALNECSSECTCTNMTSDVLRRPLPSQSIVNPLYERRW